MPCKRELLWLTLPIILHSLIHINYNTYTTVAEGFTTAVAVTVAAAPACIQVEIIM